MSIAPGFDPVLLDEINKYILELIHSRGCFK